MSLKETGKTKNVGVSNWGINHLEELVQKSLPLPSANQIEIHPWSQKPELVSYLKDKGIDIIAYSSLVPLSTWRHKNGENSLKTDEMYKDGDDLNSPCKIMLQICVTKLKYFSNGRFNLIWYYQEHTKRPYEENFNMTSQLMKKI